VDFDAVADELYAVVPGDFIALRTAHAAEAKDAGEKDLANQIAKLPKPTVGAWLINLLVREEPEQVEQFVGLGANLREAAEALDGDDLKALNKQRRQIIGALVQQAVQLGRRAGQRVGAGAEDEIRETLEAALADPSLGEVVLLGRLSKSLQYAGFGTTEPSPFGSVRPAGAVRPASARPAAAEAPVDLAKLRRERARKALDDAERALRRAEKERDAEAGRLRAAVARREEVEAKVERMRAELGETESALRLASDTERQREAELAAADRALMDATKARAKAAEAVEVD